MGSQGTPADGRDHVGGGGATDGTFPSAGRPDGVRPRSPERAGEGVEREGHLELPRAGNPDAGLRGCAGDAAGVGRRRDERAKAQGDGGRVRRHQVGPRPLASPSWTETSRPSSPTTRSTFATSTSPTSPTSCPRAPPSSRTTSTSASPPSGDTMCSVRPRARAPRRQPPRFFQIAEAELSLLHHRIRQPPTKPHPTFHLRRRKRTPWKLSARARRRPPRRRGGGAQTQPPPPPNARDPADPPEKNPRRRNARRWRRRGRADRRPLETRTNYPRRAMSAGTALYDDNPILYCEGCDVAVHQLCHGVKRVPTGDWFCRACERDGKSTRKSAASKRCCLCRWKVARSSPRPGTGGRTLRSNWLPETYIKDVKAMEPVGGIDYTDPDRPGLKCEVRQARRGRASSATSATAASRIIPCARSCPGSTAWRFDRKRGRAVRVQEFAPST